MTKKIVFLDTNGWLALLNAGDTLHVRAHKLWSELGASGYHVRFTDWIIAETGNGLARTNARRQFATSVRAMLASKRVRIVPVKDKLRQRARTLYEERADKDWGLVDCASFLVMQDQGIVEAFTNDKHFRQAGFRCLLLQHA